MVIRLLIILTTTKIILATIKYIHNGFTTFFYLGIEEDVQKVLQMFETTWKIPFEDQDLATISTGMIVTPYLLIECT